MDNDSKFLSLLIFTLPRSCFQFLEFLDTDLTVQSEIIIIYWGDAKHFPFFSMTDAPLYHVSCSLMRSSENITHIFYVLLGISVYHWRFGNISCWNNSNTESGESLYFEGDTENLVSEKVPHNMLSVQCMWSNWRKISAALDMQLVFVFGTYAESTPSPQRHSYHWYSI